MLLQTDQPIRLQHSHQIKLLAIILENFHLHMNNNKMKQQESYCMPNRNAMMKKMYHFFLLL